MVLPLLGGLIGSALAAGGTAGALAGMSPLIASALGSGIGSFIETGDLKQALGTGLTSGITGGMLGGQMGSMAGKLAGNVATEAGAQAATQAATQGAGQAIAGGVGQEAIRQAAIDASGGVGAEAIKGAANPGFFGGLADMFPGGMGSIGGETGLLGAPAIQGYTGALAAQAAMPLEVEPRDKGERSRRGPYGAPGRSLSAPAPGMGSREFDYQVKPNYGVELMQEGGLTSLAPPEMDNRQVEGRNSKQVVSDAIAAIEGTHPAPEMALGAFLKLYGEEELKALIKDVTSGQARQRRAQQAGLIQGPEGAGDLVPANIDNQQDVLLEDGEFVMTRDAVNAMGDGDNAVGGDRMMQLMKQLEMGAPA